MSTDFSSAAQRLVAAGGTGTAANVELSALTCLKRRCSDVTDNKSRVSVRAGDSEPEENESAGDEDGRDGSLSAVTSRRVLVPSPWRTMNANDGA